EAGDHVLAQGHARLARGPLVVQRDPDSLAVGDLASVDRDLIGEDAQQRRLARAVAPGQRHAIAPFELERDVAEERAVGYVLAEAGSGEDRHLIRIRSKTPSSAPRASGGGEKLAGPERQAAAGASSRTWNDDPQPQAATTFGLFTVKPA